MILAVLALASASPMPDLDAALVRYRTVVEQATTTGDTSLVPLAADNVCRVAYRYTLARFDDAAVEVVTAYRGPNRDKLLLTCSVFFAVRS